MSNSRMRTIRRYISIASASSKPSMARSITELPLGDSRIERRDPTERSCGARCWALRGGHPDTLLWLHLEFGATAPDRIAISEPKDHYTKHFIPLLFF